MFNFWPFSKQSKKVEAGGSIYEGDAVENADILLKKTYDVKEVEAQYGKEASLILKTAKQNVFGRSFMQTTKDGIIVRVVN